VTRRQGKRRVERLAAALELPDSLRVDELVQKVAASHQRGITTVLTRMPTGLSGAWVQTPARDFLFCEQETSALHREHILLHELGHLLCGHPPMMSAEQELETLLATEVPLVTSEAIRHILGRSRMSSPAEAEAERFAWLVRQRITALATPSPRTDQTALSRLEEALTSGDPARRW